MKEQKPKTLGELQAIAAAANGGQTQSGTAPITTPAEPPAFTQDELNKMFGVQPETPTATMQSADQSAQDGEDANADIDVSGLTSEELAKRYKDAEKKRRSFQSRADQFALELASLKGQVEGIKSVAPQPQPSVAPRQVQDQVSPEPKAEEYLKGVDPNDMIAIMQANQRFTNDLLAHRELKLRTEMTKQMQTALQQQRQLDALNAQATALVKRDPSFANPDGTPNYAKIEQWLNSATSDWATLHDLFAKKAAPTQPAPAGTTPERLEVPRTVAAGGGAAATNAQANGSSVSPQIKSIYRTFGAIELPPGAVLKK